MRLHYIDAGYACFGLVSERWRVVEAPPIASWAIGRGLDLVLAYWRRKGATIVEVEKRPEGQG